MASERTMTVGYRVARGRYFIVTTEAGQPVTIRQPLFGSGIYPAPVRDVPEDEWPEVLRECGLNAGGEVKQ